MIRAVLVDLDDTLLDEQRASARGRRVSSANWRRFESGRCSFQEQRRGRVREFTGLVRIAGTNGERTV